MISRLSGSVLKEKFSWSLNSIKIESILLAITE